MPISYPRMRATARRLISGNGTTWQITRPGKVTVVAGVEQVQPEQQLTAVGVRTDYQPAEVDDKLIQAGDVRIVFTDETPLMIGDLVDIDGTAYRIVKPNPVKPGALLLCYRAQLRA
ncbi:hypothetical protein ML056_003481 [Klebsiella variicola]|nr:hypothetical protein [Klebsiella variicola]